ARAAARRRPRPLARHRRPPGGRRGRAVPAPARAGRGRLAPPAPAAPPVLTSWRAGPPVRVGGGSPGSAMMRGLGGLKRRRCPAGEDAVSSVVEARRRGEHRWGESRARQLSAVGRALPILAPVAAAEALTGRRGPAAEALATVVLAAVWYVSIEAGFVASRTT